MTLPWILLVSAPRSGTNQICTLLEEFPAIHVYLEWFRPEGPSWTTPEMLRLFEPHVGEPIVDHNDLKFARWIHDNVEKTIALLEGAVDPHRRVATLKIFRNHLPLDDISRHFLDREGLRVLIVKRRPIDTYISFTKASSLDRWINVDTTAVKPELDVDDFLDWHERQSVWFEWIDEEVNRRGIPHQTITYETDVEPGPDVTLSRLERALRDLDLPAHMPWRTSVRRAGRSFANRFGLPVPDRYRLGLERQDRSTSLEEKVSNWDAFCDGLEANDRGRERLDRYFTA